MSWKMNEHDSLVSDALNNMTLNEVANAYADLKLDLKRERERKEAALRALNNVLGRDGTLSQYVQLEYIERIVRDALAAEKRAYGYREEI